MYCPMLICFFLGAAAGKSAFDRHGRSSLLLPTFFLFMMGWTYIYYLSRIRRQPFQRVLLKRVSDEIMTPHSPSHKHKQQHKNRLGLLHLPQIHIPFKQHAHHHQQPQQPQQQQQQQGARAAYHSRRHSSACDQLGKSKENTGDVDKGERAIVLDIGAPAEAPTAGSTTGDEDRNELSNHMAAIV